MEYKKGMFDALFYAEPALALSAAVRAAIAALQDYGVIITPAVEERIKTALIPPIRHLIIQDEYSRGRVAGLKSEYLLARIAERYGVSYETAYSITHERR